MKTRKRERGVGIALLALHEAFRLPPFLTLALILAVSTARAAPLPPDRGTQLLESSPTSIRFRVRFPGPEWRMEEIATGTARYPVWPGLPSLARPGEAQVGVRIIRVAVPPQGAIHVEEITAGGGRDETVRFPAAPGLEPKEARVPAKVSQAKPLPAVHAEILAVGMERGLRIATLAVRPARRGAADGDPGQGGDEIQWADEVEVRLRIDGPQPARTGSPRPDPVQAPLWRETLLNPDSVRDFLTWPAAAAAFPDTWFDDADGWLKIQITANGVYTLSHDALAAAGVPVGTIDPRTIRLFSGPLVPDLPWTTLGWDTLIAGTDTSVVSGWDSVSERPGFTTGFGETGGFEEIAIWVDGEEDGDFGTTDRMVFHALGPDNFRDRFGLAPGGEEFFENPYTKHTMYWLAWGGVFPGSPRRMAQVTVTPPGGTTPATEAIARVHAERNAEYVPYLVKPGLRTETRFWDLLSAEYVGKRFPVTLPFAVPGTSISAHIRVWGKNIPGPDTPLHRVQLDVNGVSAGPTYEWGGDSPYAALTPQDMHVSGIPVAQPSNFDFRVPSTVSGRKDESYLAWIDVTYRRALALGGLAGELPADAGAPGRTLRISQVPAGNLDLFDVTDFRSPRRLAGFTAVVTVAGPGVELALDDPGPRILAVATRSAPSSPAALVLDDPPAAFGAATWLRDPSEPLDYGVITHDAFLPEAEALADRRRESLYGITPGRSGRARAVRVSDVMDEFAWGMWDPTALRYFLEYAYRYYGGSGAEPIAYCVFLGDHTHDFRQVEVGAADLVPSWEDNQGDLGDIEGGSVQYASDDPLARFDGPRDPYLDLAIGRIPVSTSAAARAVILDKILRSETQPAYGPWRSRVLLAADDLCQGGNPDPVAPDPLLVAEAVDSLLPPEYDRSKIYLTEYGTTCDILYKPEAAADFQAAWNEGAWLVNYLGHGDETFLADERLLTLTDVPLLTNLDRLPLFIATASKSAKYNLPRQSSITEAIASSAAGGALAATGSVSNQTFADPAFALNEEFVKLLFETDLACLCPAQPRPAGLAFAAAKRIIPGEAPKYVFFGDPAGVPPAPRLTSLVLAGPDSLTRGGLASVRARLTNPTFVNGTLDLRAEDATRAPALGALPYRLPGDLMFRGESAFTADSVSAAFVVPIAAREGPDARIRGYASGADWDAVSALRDVVIQGQVDPSTDTAGPLITFHPHGAVVVVGQVLTAALEDPSGIRLFSPVGAPIELVVRDQQNTEMARLPVTSNFAYDSGSYTRGQVSFPVPDLANGPYRFTLTALDNFGNAASAAIDLEIATSVETRFHEVYAYPNPLDSETDVVFTLDHSIEVSIHIFSVSGRTVRKATVQADVGRNGWRWDGRDEAGDPVANGVYLLRLAAKGTGGEDSAEHLERLVVVR